MSSWWVSNVSRTLVSVDQSAHTARYSLTGHAYSDFYGDSLSYRFRTRIDGAGEVIWFDGGGTVAGSPTDTDYTKSDIDLTADEAGYTWNARLNSSFFGNKNDVDLGFKSAAVTATASTPTYSLVTAYTARIACDYYPNVLDSTCSAQLQYKKTTDPTWTNAGTPNTTGGYAQVIGWYKEILGLTASTQYQVRLVITRTTVNDTSLISSTASFTTLAGAPDITTDDASSIGSSSATLNATVDPNTISTDVTFEWDTDSGAPYANETSPAENFTGDGNQSVSKGITGLSFSTPYYFRAKATHAGGTVYGSEKTFTTSANPAAGAELQDMLPIQSFDRKYGVATTIYFVVPVDSATNSNTFYTGSVVWGSAGESKVSKDGAAFSDTTSDPVAVSGGLYSLALTAAELQCNEAFIMLTNSGTAVRDILLRVRTHMELGDLDIDAATGAKANTTAFKATGYGSGNGIQAIAGSTGKDIKGTLGDHIQAKGDVTTGTGTSITLTNGFAATNNYYIGSVVVIFAGTGAGQARTITASTSGGVLTLNKTLATGLDATSDYIIIPGDDVWNWSPGAELSALPTSSSGFGAMLQFLFQRFAYKRKQTATTFSMLKVDDTTTLASGGVDDDGSTQSHNRLT